MAMEVFCLNNGVEIPVTGFGVYRIPNGEDCARITAEAIDSGYRMLDTAQGYWNEESVGQGIAMSGIDRKKLFLTTKVWMSRYGEEDTRRSVMESMEKLQTDYLDLVLLHQAMADYYGAYRALEKLYGEGKIRAIGISNFSPSQLTDLSLFSKVIPAVNQIQISPFCQERQTQGVHQKFHIRMEAWSPLGAGNPELLEHPVLTGIARRYGKTTAQVILRWLFQRGIVTVVKSSRKERMRSNLQIFDFELEEIEMQDISVLDRAVSNETELEHARTIERLRQVILREEYHFKK